MQVILLEMMQLLISANARGMTELNKLCWVAIVWFYRWCLSKFYFNTGWNDALQTSYLEHTLTSMNFID